MALLYHLSAIYKAKLGKKSKYYFADMCVRTIGDTIDCQDTYEKVRVFSCQIKNRQTNRFDGVLNTN